VGTYPIDRDWALLGRFGVEHARFKTRAGDDSSNGLKLGLGVEYALNKQSALRAEYEYNHFRNVFDSSANVGMLTAGVKFNF
jgi:OOP family OmpA-OmpF porin